MTNRNRILQYFSLGLLLIGAALANAQTRITIPSLTQSKPADLYGYIYSPEGTGPFPAVVLAHGCNGIGENVKNWANFLKARGYVTLILDSLTSRSLSEVCTQQQRLTPLDRVGDAFGALKFLQSQTNVDKARIGLMGFSHGAATVLATLSESTHFPLGDAPQFAAATALYPDCLLSEVDATAPLLIQSGERDDWDAAAPCQAKVTARRSEGFPVEIEVYADALHSFDNPTVQYYYGANLMNTNKPKFCCGASVGYSASATAKAEHATEQFFARHLKSLNLNAKATWVRKPIPTRDEIVTMVKAAKALAMKSGNNKLIEMITNQDPQFRKRRQFLAVINSQGVVLAHGRLPIAVVGIDYSRTKDFEGKPLLTTLQSALEQNPSWTTLRAFLIDSDVYVERLDADNLVIGFLMK